MRGRGTSLSKWFRLPLCAVFIVAYGWSVFAQDSRPTVVMVVSGLVLIALSVPRASAFHKGLAVASVVALGVAVLRGDFDAATYLEELPMYFGIIAVLLILTLAGYPLRAARYEGQILALRSWLVRRGASNRTTASVMGQVLSSVLDVGSLVLVDVIFSRSSAKERREALRWTARSFSFVTLWSSLNLLPVTAITVAGITYPDFLRFSLPVAVIGFGCLLFFAQRGTKTLELQPESPESPLDRGAAAVVLYPLSLMVVVFLVNRAFPELGLTAVISLTVVASITFLALLAAVVTRRASPLARLVNETRDSLTRSHSEFALFGSAGVLVVSLEVTGALRPLGGLMSNLPLSAVPIALFFVIALGFVCGIHVLPMILLLDAAFPLDAVTHPALCAVAIVLGSQAAILMTPFSNGVTMLARLSGKHPLDVGFKDNWRFSLAFATLSLSYLALVSFVIL